MGLIVRSTKQPSNLPVVSLQEIMLATYQAVECMLSGVAQAFDVVTVVCSFYCELFVLLY